MSDEFERVRIYEDGKHRRYSLLFAVNGGAFAVAKVLTGESGACAVRVLGRLTLSELAVGMAIFTILMVYDIFEFGYKWKRKANVFGRTGQVVLVCIGLLLLGGWLFVGW
jgi:hypothetical protein